MTLTMDFSDLVDGHHQAEIERLCDAMEAAYQAGSLQTFTIQLQKTAAQTTTGDKYVFTGYVVSSDFSIAPTKQIEFTMELQTSGAIVPTVGS